MFTGIIQEVGKVNNVRSLGGGVQIIIAAPRTSIDLEVNHSVSVNGVCQTVVAKADGRFTVVAVEETLAKTTLGTLKAHDPINLELALQLGDRLGGHLVSGHVDSVGVVEAIEKQETSWLVRISIPSQFRRYVIPVGSIAIDGVSLTVAAIEGETITVSVIPHTMENTIFSAYSLKSRVNLEFDMIGKYIERLVAGTQDTLGESIAAEQLKKWGYDI